MDKDRFKQAEYFLESLNNIARIEVPKSRAKRKYYIKRLGFLLKSLGDPQKNLKFIHIAGTSGKGSTAFILEHLFTRAGFRIGLLSSPHISSVTERIRISGKLISPSDFSRYLQIIKPHLDICAKKSPLGVPSYFEVIIAIAFLYFRDKKCDQVIVEAGIGGASDPTNIIENKTASIITNIGLDHIHLLGKTKKEIAQEKAGIIKTGATFFTTEENPGILKIFREACRKKRTFFNKVDLSFKINKNDLSGVKFEYQGEKYQTKLIGAHQVKNIVLAMSVFQVILNKKIETKFLTDLVLPCRLEVMQKNPLVMIDGAHNPDKIRSTVEFVRENKQGKLHLIITMARNKDLSRSFDQIIPVADSIYLTRFLMPFRRVQSLAKMYKKASGFLKKKIDVFIDPTEAFNAAIEKAGPKDAILITGSYFLSGELRKKWISKEHILEKRKMF